MNIAAPRPSHRAEIADLVALRGGGASALDLKPTPRWPKPRSRGSSASNSATRSATGSRRENLSLPV